MTKIPPKGVWDHPAVRLWTAIGLYVCFSIYLFGPYLKTFSLSDVGFIVTPFLAAAGIYVLSSRWLFSWGAKLFTGAIYGFGPFALSMAIYRNPLAGLSYAIIPWLLLPAAFWQMHKKPNALRFCVRILLSLLPFAAIAVLFRLTANPAVGPTAILPLNAALELKDMAALVFPLYKAGEHVSFALYHTSVMLALMGVFVYIQLKRITVLIPAAIGLVLAFMAPVMNISPIVWTAFPILFLSILSGLGFQAIVSAGKTDSKWVLTCAIAASVLTAFFGAMTIRIISPFRRPFELTMMMYALTTAALWITLFCLQKFPRHHIPRWLLLTTAMTIDLIFSARYLIDKLF